MGPRICTVSSESFAHIRWNMSSPVTHNTAALLSLSTKAVLHPTSDEYRRYCTNVTLEEGVFL
jgi:hypothetical protein